MTTRAPKAAAIARGLLTAYIGEYEIAADRTLTVTEEVWRAKKVK